MIAKKRKKYIFVLFQSLKIGVGSGVAMYLAMASNLDFAVYAATVTMLTVVTTKAEVMKLSLYRFITFAITVLLCYIIFPNIPNMILGYMLFLFSLVFITDFFNLRETLSVNAVVGTHFLTTMDFSLSAVTNEFLLVLIGITTAVMFNFLVNNQGSKRRLKHNVVYTENRLKLVLNNISKFLRHEESVEVCWDYLDSLSDDISHFIELAYEYKGNSFGNSEKDMYAEYFELRKIQCEMLETLKKPLKFIIDYRDESIIVAELIEKISNDISNFGSNISVKTFKEVYNPDMKSFIEIDLYAKLYHTHQVLFDFALEQSEYKSVSPDIFN